MQKFKSFVDLIERLQIALGVLAMGIIAFITPLQVFLRYTFNSPLIWIEDTSTALMIWLAFLGVPILYRRRGHVAVDYFLTHFPTILQNLCYLVFDFLVAFLSLLLIIYGYTLNALQFRLTAHSVAWGVPRNFMFAFPLLVCFISSFIYSLFSILNNTALLGKVNGPTSPSL